MPQRAAWHTKVRLEEWLLERRLPSEGWLRSLGLRIVQLRRRYTWRTQHHLNGGAQQTHMLTTTSAPNKTKPRISKSTASWLPRDAVIRIYTEINAQCNESSFQGEGTQVPTPVCAPRISMPSITALAVSG